MDQPPCLHRAGGKGERRYRRALDHRMRKSGDTHACRREVQYDKKRGRDNGGRRALAQRQGRRTVETGATTGRNQNGKRRTRWTTKDIHRDRGTAGMISLNNPSKSADGNPDKSFRLPVMVLLSLFSLNIPAQVSDTARIDGKWFNYPQRTGNARLDPSVSLLPAAIPEPPLKEEYLKPWREEQEIIRQANAEGRPIATHYNPSIP